MKDRRDGYRVVSDKLFEKFKLKRTENLPINDKDLRRWALQINLELENCVVDFRASSFYIKSFKQHWRIVSRKV